MISLVGVINPKVNDIWKRTVTHYLLENGHGCVERLQEFVNRQIGQMQTALIDFREVSYRPAARESDR